MKALGSCTRGRQPSTSRIAAVDRRPLVAGHPGRGRRAGPVRRQQREGLVDLDDRELAASVCVTTTSWSCPNGPAGRVGRAARPGDQLRARASGARRAWPAATSGCLAASGGLLDAGPPRRPVAAPPRRAAAAQRGGAVRRAGPASSAAPRRRRSTSASSRSRPRQCGRLASSSTRLRRPPWSSTTCCADVLGGGEVALRRLVVVGGEDELADGGPEVRARPRCSVAWRSASSCAHRLDSST